MSFMLEIGVPEVVALLSFSFLVWFDLVQGIGVLLVLVSQLRRHQLKSGCVLGGLPSSVWSWEASRLVTGSISRFGSCPSFKNPV